MAYLADNKALEIDGKGDVCMKTPVENKWTLKDSDIFLVSRKI